MSYTMSTLPTAYDLPSPQNNILIFASMLRVAH